MKIADKFSEQQKELLNKLNININNDFDAESLEELEDKVYEEMMNNLDEKQDYTPKAEEFEAILDIVVEIENENE